MNNSVVSVVIPCYNQSQYLIEAVESVLIQTYIYWECIIVNDGSTDSTEIIAEKLCKKDKRIRYLYKENGGISLARNFGIKNSIGKYILPLDADDKIGKKYLEQAVKLLDAKSELKIVYCRGMLFGKKNKEIISPQYSIELMLCRNLIFCSGVFRRIDYEKTQGYNSNMQYGLEDWDFWLSLLETGGEVFKINEILFFYRIKSISRTTSLLEQSKLKMMRRQIWKNHRELYAKYFLDPTQCFEYVLISESKEFLLGRIILKPIRKFLSLFN